MLNNWLSPVSSEYISPYFNSSFHTKSEFPNLEKTQIVFFTSCPDFGNRVRNKMSSLFNNFNIPIIDIGNLNVHNSTSVYQVVSELQDGHILPVLIGINQNDFIDFCKSMTLEHKLEKAAFISNKALVPKEEYSVENIAYQRHLVPQFILNEVHDSSTPGLSLGTLRTNKRILEPILREINYLHFDLAALRYSDCPTKTDIFPTGLFAEEACQIMRYVGEGIRLKLVTVDTQGLGIDSDVEATLLAELIWYLHEGVQQKSIDHPAISSDFKEFIIEMNEIDHSLIFLQSNKSGKWWLQKEKSSNKYISCAYEEYEQAINNDLPDRLLKLL